MQPRAEAAETPGAILQLSPPAAHSHPPQEARPDGSVFLDWPIAPATCSQTFSRPSAFRLQLDVFLPDRGQQRHEYAEPGEDVMIAKICVPALVGWRSS